MTKHRKILNIISNIRNSHTEMQNIFLYGSCINLFLILHSVFQDAEPYYNVGHVITKIDNRFYDISGTVSGVGYSKFTSYHNKRRTSRAFIQMFRAELKLNNQY